MGLKPRLPSLKESRGLAGSSQQLLTDALLKSRRDHSLFLASCVYRTHSTLESPGGLYIGTAACQLGQKWPVLVLPHHLPPSKGEMAPSLEGADLWEFASKKLHSQKIQAPLGSDNTGPGASACQHLGALFTSKQATK